MSHRLMADLVAALAANPGCTRAEIAKATGWSEHDGSRDGIARTETRIRALHKAGMAYITGWQWRPKKNTAPADWIPCWSLQPRPGWYCDAQKPRTSL